MRQQETRDYLAGIAYDGLLAKYRILAMWAKECEQMICEMGERTWAPSARLVEAYEIIGEPVPSPKEGTPKP